MSHLRAFEQLAVLLTMELELHMWNTLFENTCWVHCLSLVECTVAIKVLQLSSLPPSDALTIILYLQLWLQYQYACMVVSAKVLKSDRKDLRNGVELPSLTILDIFTYELWSTDHTHNSCYFGQLAFKWQTNKKYIQTTKSNSTRSDSFL